MWKVCDAMDVLETCRLVLSEMSAGDYPALCEILQDPLVMYAYEGAFSDAEVAAWLEKQLCRYDEHGFGLWAVRLKETGEMVGQCGLTMQDWNGRQVLEVGYLLKRSHWHRGYATEAATGCIAYAFDVLGVAEVCSIIRDTNLPSQHVAARVGMKKVDGIMIKHYRGIVMPHYLYVRHGTAVK